VVKTKADVDAFIATRRILMENSKKKSIYDLSKGKPKKSHTNW
jgi:hypothetical protein